MTSDTRPSSYSRESAGRMWGQDYVLYSTRSVWFAIAGQYGTHNTLIVFCWGGGGRACLEYLRECAEMQVQNMYVCPIVYNITILLLEERSPLYTCI